MNKHVMHIHTQALDVHEQKQKTYPDHLMVGCLVWLSPASLHLDDAAILLAVCPAARCIVVLHLVATRVNWWYVVCLEKLRWRSGADLWRWTWPATFPMSGLLQCGTTCERRRRLYLGPQE